MDVTYWKNGNLSYTQRNVGSYKEAPYLLYHSLYDVWCLKFQTCYIFVMEIVRGLERGPLSLVITTEELLEKRSSGSGLENRD
jgi:hypothetical protein